MKYPKFTHKTPHLKGKQHQLDPNLDLKQLVKHATVQYVDWDNDGDVDEYDKKPKLVPDENPTGNFGRDSKKLIAKQKGEIKHTKKGMAYEDLRKWFGTGGEGGVGGGGWDEYNTKGERTGKCARGENDDGEGPKPKCLSKEKAAKMTKKEIAAAVKRKRKEDPVADRSGKGGKPKMVSNNIEEGLVGDLVDKIKGRKQVGTTGSGGKVYVSTRPKQSTAQYQQDKPKPKPKLTRSQAVAAAANDPWTRGAFSRDDVMRARQDMNAARLESKEESRYCMMCKKVETRNECSYGPEMWDKMTYKYFLESKKSQPDHEHSMARSELATIEKAVKRLKTKMKGEGNIEAWVQSKITRAADYIDAAADYLDSGEHNVEESMDEAKKGPCWKGYRKKPGTADYEEGSCVKVSEASFEITHTSSDVQRAKRKKKIDALAQRGIGGEQQTAARMAGASLPPIRKEEVSLVEKILLEMEAEVLTEKNKPTNPKLWAKWKSKAKAKFDVYPSAYANGWAAKGYKSEGGGWESVSEDITIEDANGNTFAEITDIISIPRNTNEDEICPYCGCDPCECEGSDLDEAIRIPTKSGNLLMVVAMWRGKTYALRVFFPQTKMPTKKEVEQEIQKIYPDSRVTYFKKVDREPGQPFLQVEDWQKVNRKDRTPGMSQDAVDKYKEENQESKLQTAVTEKNPTGKRAERQNSFCRRSKGQKDMHNIDCSKTPDKPICKARRRWNCKGDS